MDAPKPFDPKGPDLPEERKSSEPGAYISPRLREKLGGGDDDFFEPKSGNATNWVVAGMLVVIAVLAGVVVFRGRGPSPKTSATAAEAPPTAPAAPVDSSATKSDSSATTPPATAATPPATPPPGVTASGGAAKPATPPAAKPAAKPAATPPAGATAEPAAPPKPQGHFGIKVGSYLNEDRAKTELDRLKTASGLDARILTVDDGGSPSYQIVLGDFGSRKEADKKAADLITKGAVEEAVVVPVKQP